MSFIGFVVGVVGSVVLREILRPVWDVDVEADGAQSPAEWELVLWMSVITLNGMIGYLMWPF